MAQDKYAAYCGKLLITWLRFRFRIENDNVNNIDKTPYKLYWLKVYDTRIRN